jgi:hypothetical protein
MHNDARCKAVALARGWPEPVMGWTRAQGMQARLRRLRRGGGDNDGRKKRANVVNSDLCESIYSGVHRVCPLRLLPPYDAHCNGSIPII